MFTRNWDDSLLTGQVIWGTGGQAQSVVSGRCRVAASANCSALSQFSDEPTIADFDATFTFYLNTNSSGALAYRTTYWGNTDGGCAYIAHFSGTAIDLYRGSNSSTSAWTLLKSVTRTQTANTAYVMRVRAVEGYHEIWVDGTQLITYYDATFLAAGQFGLRTYGTVAPYTEYDNLTVTDLTTYNRYERGVLTTPNTTSIKINSNVSNRGYITGRTITKTTNPLFVPVTNTTFINNSGLYATLYSPKTLTTIVTPNKKRVIAVWSREFNVLTVDTNGSISGTVDINDVPVTNTLVRLYFKANGFYINETYTDSEGKFKFDSLEVGKPYYTVIAYVNDYNTLIFNDVKPVITIY